MGKACDLAPDPPFPVTNASRSPCWRSSHDREWCGLALFHLTTMLANRGDRTQYLQPRFALVAVGGYRDVGCRSRTPIRARGREPARALPGRLRCPSQLARCEGRAALPTPVLG